MHFDMAASHHPQELRAAAFVWPGTPPLDAFHFVPAGEFHQPAKDIDMQESMQRLTRPLAAAAFAAACVVGVPAVFGVPAIGAQAQSQTPKPDTSAQPQNIPDQKLDAAAAAMEQIASLRESYQQKLEAAPPSDKKRIAEEANTALEKAVTDKGLSVDEYSEILAVAQANPEVRGRIIQRIRPAEKK
jgi:hypothetical protein